MTERETIKVLYIKPDCTPVIKEIVPDMSSIEQMIPGEIQCLQPFDDPVGIIYNPDADEEDFEMNREIRVGRKYIDIITGDFFICYIDPETGNYGSLPPNLMKKYKNKFRYPEVFRITIYGLEVLQRRPPCRYEPER